MNPPPRGWYPDPSGAPGMQRWWDGRTWTVATRPTPGTAPEPRAEHHEPETIPARQSTMAVFEERHRPPPPPEPALTRKQTSAAAVIITMILVGLVVVFLGRDSAQTTMTGGEAAVAVLRVGRFEPGDDVRRCVDAKVPNVAAPAGTPLIQVDPAERGKAITALPGCVPDATIGRALLADIVGAPATINDTEADCAGKALLTHVPAHELAQLGVEWPAGAALPAEPATRLAAAIDACLSMPERVARSVLAHGVSPDRVRCAAAKAWDSGGGTAGWLTRGGEAPQAGITVDLSACP